MKLILLLLLTAGIAVAQEAKTCGIDYAIVHAPLVPPIGALVRAA